MSDNTYMLGEKVHIKRGNFAGRDGVITEVYQLMGSDTLYIYEVAVDDNVSPIRTLAIDLEWVDRHETLFKKIYRETVTQIVEHPKPNEPTDIVFDRKGRKVDIVPGQTDVEVTPKANIHHGKLTNPSLISKIEGGLEKARIMTDKNEERKETNMERALKVAGAKFEPRTKEFRNANYTAAQLKDGTSPDVIEKIKGIGTVVDNDGTRHKREIHAEYAPKKQGGERMINVKYDPNKKAK